MNKTSRSEKLISALRRRFGSVCLGLATILIPTVFAISAQAQSFKLLHTFTGGTDGGDPAAGLIMDAQGNLYGTAAEGGNPACLHGCGTVFKISSTGKLTVLHRFTGSNGDGVFPSAKLLRDGEGNLYGTTDLGGNFACNAGLGCGTVFKLDSLGKETILHSFNEFAAGRFPLFGGLTRDAENNLYGTTYEGGSSTCPRGCGTVFKLSASGEETVLYRFTGTAGDGSFPPGGVVRDSSGNLYGTTQAGGASNAGTLFKVDQTGKETGLFSFNVTDGLAPMAGLMQDSGGNLYGASYSGGTGVDGGAGVVFKFNVVGQETVIYAFPGSQHYGSHPQDSLVRDSQGNLYGTTVYGGAFGYGTVFKVNQSGKETVLHSFNYAVDGANPIAGLLRDAAGNLYGTTTQGGTRGYGTVFKLIP